MPAARAAGISTPGAVTSGFIAPSPRRGPRLEKYASLSLPSTAPTVSASDAAPGEPTVSSAPALPAAITNSAPLDFDKSSTAWLIGSVPSVGRPPKLMLMIFAPCWTAHSIPAIASESYPPPLLSRTLPISRPAPGATPFSFPPDAVPRPATIDAVWVPWPNRSWTASPGTKLSDATTCLARSGCPASYPVSSTATLTPRPSYPAFHAAGAPICRVDWSRVAWVRPSSQILLTWLPLLKAVGPLMLSQKVLASAFRTVTALLSTLGRVRRRVAAAGVDGALRRVAGAVRRRGNWSLPASSYPCATRSVRLNSCLSRRPSLSSW